MTIKSGFRTFRPKIIQICVGCGGELKSDEETKPCKKCGMDIHIECYSKHDGICLVCQGKKKNINTIVNEFLAKQEKKKSL